MPAVTPIQRTSTVNTSIPGWANVLAGGVLGAIAAHDFVNQLYWMHGNPSGGLIGSIPVDGSGLIVSSNILYIEGGFLAAGNPGSILINISGATNTTNGVVIGLGVVTSPFEVTASNAITFKTGSHTLVATLGTGTVSGNVVAACSFGPDGRSLVANGGTLVSDVNSGSYAAAAFFGNFSGTNNCGGHIQSAVFWPSRLTNTTLQQLAS
jgi:hypothetical protein